jgi:endonuclease/exonuclease/phosphatase family metal-dependent hydrolase
VRVLSWNLFHGRSLPPAGRSLAQEFSARIASWEWDVALLQEVPPWWPPELARASGAQQRAALTSRNWLLGLRRAVAERRPDLIKSNGGGCNAILVRGQIAEHRALRLRIWPERRVAQLARLGDGTCVANFHASTRVPLAEYELERLWAQALSFAGGAPLILGGDLNLRAPLAPGEGIVHVAARDVDHIFARWLEPVGTQQLLDRRVTGERGMAELSDHPPLAIRLSRPPCTVRNSTQRGREGRAGSHDRRAEGRR